MTITAATDLPVPRPSVVWAKLPDGGVLFTPEDEVYYGLNLVAASVWEQLGRPDGSMEKLCAEVLHRFPGASPEQIRVDVAELFDELNRAGLVHTAARPAA